MCFRWCLIHGTPLLSSRWKQVGYAKGRMPLFLCRIALFSLTRNYSQVMSVAVYPVLHLEPEDRNIRSPVLPSLRSRNGRQSPSHSEMCRSFSMKGRRESSGEAKCLLLSIWLTFSGFLFFFLILLMDSTAPFSECPIFILSTCRLWFLLQTTLCLEILIGKSEVF